MMVSPAARWTKAFPYRDTHVVVERLPHEWALTLGDQHAQARTLVTAFELLLRRPAANGELDVVLLALALDRRAKQSD
jgi:hypothetical protein